MDYEIKSVNIAVLVWTSLLLLLVPTVITLALRSNDFIPATNPLLAIFFFAGFVAAILNIIFVNHKRIICSIFKETLVIRGDVIRWAEVKNYKISDDSPEFKKIKIKTYSGKSYTIGHRKKFEKKDDLNKFITAFENMVNYLKNRGTTITKTPQLWDTPDGKWYGYVLLVIILAFTIVLFVKKNHRPSVYTNYLILLGGSVPLLYRIFKKK